MCFHLLELQFIQNNLIERKVIDISKVIIGSFHSPFTLIDRISRTKSVRIYRQSEHDQPNWLNEYLQNILPNDNTVHSCKCLSQICKIYHILNYKIIDLKE